MSKKNRVNRNKKWVPIVINDGKLVRTTTNVEISKDIDCINTVDSVSKGNLINSLIEMFPSVSPSCVGMLSDVDIDVETINSLITNLIGKESNEIERIILDICGQSEDMVEKMIEDEASSDVESLDEENDAALLGLEKSDDEAHNCLVIGRRFLEMAHDKFGKEFGTSDLRIEDFPLEITEMGWNPGNQLMRSIYHGFMTYLGVLGDQPSGRMESGEQVTQTSVKKESKEDYMTLREVMELEQASNLSLEQGRKQINLDEGLQLQMAGLKLRYPQLAEHELERVFIGCQMNTSDTVAELNKTGYRSHSAASAASRINNINRNKKVKNDSSDGICDVNDCTTQGERMQRLQLKLEQLLSREKHIKLQISNICSSSSSRSKGGGLMCYWREEIRVVRTQIDWYRCQVGLATVNQRKLVTGQLELDLHGLTANAACHVLQIRLDDMRKCRRYREYGIGGGRHLKVICGRGLHSPGGISRLRPVIRRYLHDQSLHFEQKLDGVFYIPLKQLCAGT